MEKGRGTGRSPNRPAGGFCGLRPQRRLRRRGLRPDLCPFCTPSPGAGLQGRRQAANRQKKRGREGAAFPAEGTRQRARASGRRPGGAFGAADAGKACVPRLRRGGLRPSTSPAQTSPRYHQILPNPPPSPGKIPPRPRKKAPPHRDGALLTFFGFSPAWQGRRGCGRGSPHGPAPPPALCRRRG